MTFLIIDVIYDECNYLIAPYPRSIMQSSYPALALPDLEDVLEQSPLIVAPETSVLAAIALMSQVDGSLQTFAILPQAGTVARWSLKQAN
jgi:hypothetical protein